ncbi:MAG TPA: hypothetical protein VK454_13635 [Myxococcaceae bacterium]|nr:hypothetical protein [Myxococcaceae bacterium]
MTHALRTADDWKQARGELQGRLSEWDPIDLLSAGAPPDEYDALVSSLMQRLDAGASGEELAGWLGAELGRRYGHAPPVHETDVFCRRTAKWFHARWPAEPG